MSETIEVMLRDKNKSLGNSADENFNCRAELTNLKKQLNEVKNDVNGLATKFTQLEKNIGDRLEKHTAEIVDILHLHLPIGGPGPNNAPQLPVPVPAHDNLSISEENLTVVYETRIIRREKFTNMDEYMQMPRNERPHSQIICTTSDFKVLLNGSNVIADKSTFLMEWFRRNESSIFALPKGVGKSCLLSMAKQFFSISANNFGSEADPFTENGFQFKIMEEEFRAFRECNKNKWPVIFVRFTTVIGSHFDDISLGFQAAICEAFKEHEYLIQWLEFGMQKKREAEKFKKYFYEDVSLIEAIRGIPFLAENLHAYHKRKVLVIVDDYDKALEEIACNNYSEDEEIRKIYKMVKNFLTGVLTKNDKIERVLIAGAQLIVVEDVIAYGMRPSKFTKYFGFTMHEFDLLCNYFSLDNQALLEAAKFYYNGYIDEGNIPLYSTHSCVKFFRQFQEEGTERFSIQATPPKHNIQDQQQKPLMRKYRLTSFFEEYGYTFHLTKLFQHDDIAKLIRTLANGGKIISPELRKKFTFEDFIRIRNMVARPEIEVDEDGKQLFWQFLYSSGFIVELPKKMGQKEINAQAPNAQMRDLLANKLKTFYTVKYRFSDEDMNPVTDELFEIFTETDRYTGSRKNDKVIVMRFPKLEQALSKLLRKLPIFEGKLGFQYIPIQEAARVRGNEHIIHFITDMAAIRMPGWLEFGADYRMNIVPYDWIKKKEKKSKEATTSTRQPETRPDISVKNVEVGMVIELKYEDEEEDEVNEKKKRQAKSKKPIIEKHLTALKQIGENCYLQIFWKDNICTKIIALGISVNKSKQVTVGAVIREIDDKKEDIEQFVEHVSKELYLIDNPKPK